MGLGEIGFKSKILVLKWEGFGAAIKAIFFLGDYFDL